MSWASDFHFTVDPNPKPKAEVFAPSGGWGTVMPAVAPWAASQQTPLPQPYQSDENLKKAFGIELAKAKNPFEAGCKVFEEDTSKALWASVHWLVDPLVIASRDVYLKTLEFSAAPLDREQLAAKVLALADEKVEKNGVLIPTIEAKERINALKLYSDIMGFTGKVEIDNSTKTFNHNELTIKLVKADQKKSLAVDNAPNKNIKSEMTNDASLPVTLKLVGASR